MIHSQAKSLSCEDCAVTDSPETTSSIIKVEINTAGTTKAQEAAKKIVPAVSGRIPAAA
jgi:hypothetical protein